MKTKAKKNVKIPFPVRDRFMKVMVDKYHKKKGKM